MAHAAYSYQPGGRSARSQGVHGSGARTYRPEQAARVEMILKNECVGRRNTMTAETLADRVDLPGRAVRDVVRDLELARKLLTDFSEGYYICETAEEAERATRRLESQVKHMQERITARREMTLQLRTEQERLL